MRRLFFFKIYLIAILLFVLPSPGYSENFTLHNLKLNSADNIKIRDARGRTHNLKDFYGKPLIVHFWATWCGPCVAEMPKLDKFQRHFGTDKLKILTISVDYKGMKKVKPFFKKHRLRSMEPFIDVKGKLSSAFKIKGLPATIIIDAKGKEIGKISGAIDWDSTKVRELFANML